MRKISILFVLLMLSEILSAGPRPVQIIRCLSSKARTTTVKAIPSTNHFCSPEATIAALPDKCATGKVTMTFTVGGGFLAGEALTIFSMSNIVLADGSHSIVDTLNTGTMENFRPAFVADTDGLVEVEFTRNISLPSEIILRNANSGARVPIIIPACGTAGNAIPTMGEWGLMSLGLILLIFGVIAIRQSILRQSHSIR